MSRAKEETLLSFKMNFSLFILLVIPFCLATDPLNSEEGQKITFSEDNELQYEEDESAAETDDDYDNYRWVAVDKEGVETEGTLEEARALFLEDSDNLQENSDPATSAPSLEDEYDPSTSSPNEERNEFVSEMLKQIQKRRVFRPDERRKVSPVNRYPYTAIGQIECGCTGTLIARRTVLTAARCLYRRRTGWNRRLNFHQAKDCNPDQGAALNWTRAVVYRAWTRNESPRNDIGIIILACPSVSFMPIGYTNRRALRRSLTYNAGYQCDKPNQCLWRTSCRISGFSGYGSTQLRHQCDTNRCSIGSALYQYQRRGRGRGRMVIYGIHVRSLTTHNRATRMTRRHVRTMRRWIRRFNGN
ncbi:PREDICTED: uncharacterized protein LOC109583341 [Amphimedon queenslandica]|uniref:Peptidase S1 domain-containing protein n=1 Tax=Amphimedon queenslandica TaxID=400682 RepID=A0A1X7UI09_AMPQE|nr:PREDICTED: uncharacterized protein LOC109583341 [Amphimedon queenslandica]|eukprot:XP_019854199.1 PREDICTED: uncharacterized protein LOC109583341 [Amphimedon queenslandica]